MPKKKSKSITESGYVMLAITSANKKIFAHFEMELMRQRGVVDCVEVPNAEIINRAASLAYRYHRKTTKRRTLLL